MNKPFEEKMPRLVAERHGQLAESAKLELAINANLDAVKTHGSMAADYVSMTDQRDFRLTFPRIREQKAIAAVLGALDDKIELNRRMNRVTSTKFSVLTPTNAPWSFIHAAMTQPEVSDHLGQMADGGAYPAVRPEIIGAMKLAVANEPKILAAFNRTCAPLFEQAEANRTQSRTLATLRDTLLPKLLSGELSATGTAA